MLQSSPQLCIALSYCCPQYSPSDESVWKAHLIEKCTVACPFHCPNQLTSGLNKNPVPKKRKVTVQLREGRKCCGTITAPTQPDFSHYEVAYPSCGYVNTLSQQKLALLPKAAALPTTQPLPWCWHSLLCCPPASLIIELTQVKKAIFPKMSFQLYQRMCSIFHNKVQIQCRAVEFLVPLYFALCL